MALVCRVGVTSQNQILTACPVPVVSFPKPSHRYLAQSLHGYLLSIVPLQSRFLFQSASIGNRSAIPVSIGETGSQAESETSRNEISACDFSNPNGERCPRRQNGVRSAEAVCTAPGAMGFSFNKSAAPIGGQSVRLPTPRAVSANDMAQGQKCKLSTLFHCACISAPAEVVA